MPTRIDNHDRERVIEATDLVELIGEHLDVRPKGREHVCMCPFHDDSKPSLTIVTHRDRPFYHCFACQAHGDAISFMMEYHKMSFPEALRTLAERAGIQLKESEAARVQNSRRADLLRATKAAAGWYRKHLLDEASGRVARGILAERGVTEATSETFGIGVAPDGWDGLCTKVQELERHARGGDRDPIPFEAFIESALLKPRREGKGHYDVFRNRLIFPICDEMGRPIAFGARRLDPEDEPKYLNSPESELFDKSRVLYGLHLAKKAIIEQGHAVVVEGYTDVIACHQAGHANVVATLGTALTPSHASKLQRLCQKVTLLFDGDTAGMKAANRAAEVFFNSEIDVRICSLPSGSDPDELLRTEEGRADFQAHLDGALDILEHITTGFRTEFRAAEGITARQRVMRNLLDRLATLGFDRASGLRKHLVLDAISTTTGMPEAELTRELASRRRKERPAESAAPREPGPDHEPIEAEHAPAPAPQSEVSPRRREAERRVLALFLYSPELASQSLDAGEGMMLPASELCPAEQFDVPEHRLIAEVLIPEVEAGRHPGIDQMLLALEDPAAAGLIADLFRFGSEMIRNTQDPDLELLQTTCEDLAHTARLERFVDEKRAEPDQPHPVSLSDQLDRIRRRGSDRSILPRVERPKKPMSPPLFKKSDRRPRR